MKTKNRGENAPSEKQVVDEILFDETRLNELKGKSIMFTNVKIRMTHLETGVNCEFDMTDDVKPADVKAAIKALFENGFTKTASSAATNKPDLAGKTASVVSVEKIADKKQWKVTVTLHETGAGQATFNTFKENFFRKGDRVRLTKNEAGYLDGTIINDENLDGKTQADIPF